jgi:hypothetical protein
MCLNTKEIFKETTFYKWFDDNDRYGYTRWNEGSGWSGLPADGQIEAFCLFIGLALFITLLIILVCCSAYWNKLPIKINS